MKGLSKKVLLTRMMIVVLLIAVLAGCGGKSPSELIVGRWIYEEDTDCGFEFYTNGDVVSFSGSRSEEAEWSISEDTLKLTNPRGSEFLLMDIIEVTKDRLILYADDQEIVLNKAK